MKLLALLAICFLAHEVAAIQQCASVTEHELLNITCPAANQIITSIDFASYGYPTLCPNATINETCHAPSSNFIVGQACVGLKECSVNATNPTFYSDPCFLQLKHLVVVWSCNDTTSLVCNQAPEFTTMTLKCPPNHVIAENFGVVSWGTPSACPSPAINETCHFNNTLAFVQNCTGSNTCDIVAKNEYFGNDPCETTAKRLVVQHQCTALPILPTAPTINTVLLLENGIGSETSLQNFTINGTLTSMWCAECVMRDASTLIRQGRAFTCVTTPVGNTTTAQERVTIYQFYEGQIWAVNQVSESPLTCTDPLFTHMTASCQPVRPPVNNLIPQDNAPVDDVFQQMQGWTEINGMTNTTNFNPSTGGFMTVRELHTIRSITVAPITAESLDEETFQFPAFP